MLRLEPVGAEVGERPCEAVGGQSEILSQILNVSLDELLTGCTERVRDEKRRAGVRPDYPSLHPWELYSEEPMVEFRQSREEGIDIGEYEELFKAVSHLPGGEYKERIADVMFDIVSRTPLKKDYEFDEPSELDEIKMCRGTVSEKRGVDKSCLRDKIAGAWYGRICGCFLGKPIEGVRNPELGILLRETGNYPMHRYIKRSELSDELLGRVGSWLGKNMYADISECAPADDDTNYTVLYQELIEKYGRDFTSKNVADIWLDRQPKNAYCTAERAAFCNFVKGFDPPTSAEYKNPYREWIGAQIRGDYFGYINPGDPVTAADMAYRDACVSHTKNGIYCEIFSVPVVDTTAAGDTFLGFFFAMLERFGAERALKIASAASAVAVSRPGASASIPTLDEVKKFLEERGESLL
ncbi:MAG: PfkB family carbohydrate kinase [Acutalibacteraceae bacterium]|nr:PfkB family carbohydrate kinase [Acutalibacteraceae bacterium]